MVKKNYKKPSMKVIDLPHRSNLLVGSYPGEIHTPTIPGLPLKNNHLA
jgi:hypothetical protein